MNTNYSETEHEEIAESISVMQEMVEKIETEDVSYSELCDPETEFWGDGVAVALGYVKIKPPFEDSFNMYDEAWYELHRDAVLLWFRTLVLEMSMLTSNLPHKDASYED